jgi:hypothetical protein
MSHLLHNGITLLQSRDRKTEVDFDIYENRPEYSVFLIRSSVDQPKETFCK